MGFRCPACNKDFGINKNAFLAHIENCGDGLAKNMVGMYTVENETEAAANMKEYANKLKTNLGGKFGKL